MNIRLLLVPLLLGACVMTDDEPAPDETAVARIVRCPILMCGENGPTAGDGFLFDELDLWGRENHAGVKFSGAYWDDGSSAYVDLVRDDLRAYHYGLGVWRRGYELTRLTLRMEQPSTGTAYEVRVANFEPQAVQFRAGDAEPLHLYELQARRIGGNKKWLSVCKPDIPLDTDLDWSRTPHHAVIYRGDRYSADKKVVADDPTDGWAFIACAATVGAKLHINRHTNAGGYDRAGRLRWPTSLSKRTTMLKALTADYCGDGTEEFTTFGQPLAYAHATEPGLFYTPYPTVRSIEGLWSDSGALCLDTPRRHDAGITHAFVEEKCGRVFKSCDLSNPPSLTWTSRAYVLTANP